MWVGGITINIKKTNKTVIGESLRYTNRASVTQGNPAGGVCVYVGPVAATVFTEAAVSILWL